MDLEYDLEETVDCTDTVLEVSPTILPDDVPQVSLSPVELATVETPVVTDVKEEKGSYDSFFAASDIWTTETLYLQNGEFLTVACPTKIVAVRSCSNTTVQVTRAVNVVPGSTPFDFTPETVFQPGCYYIVTDTENPGLHIELSLKHASPQTTSQLVHRLYRSFVANFGQELPDIPVTTGLVEELQEIRQSIEQVSDNLKSNPVNSTEVNTLRAKVEEQENELTSLRFEVQSATEKYNRVYQKLKEAEDYIMANLTSY